MIETLLTSNGPVLGYIARSFPFWPLVAGSYSTQAFVLYNLAQRQFLMYLLNSMLYDSPKTWFWPGGKAHGKTSFEGSDCHKLVGCRVVKELRPTRSSREKFLRLLSFLI